VRSEVDTFMFGGHDTTAVAAGWSLFYLGHHPDVQEKIHDELDSIFGDDRERDITKEDLASMKYLECCIKESLRINPSAPDVSRNLVEDLKIGEYTIPANTMVIVSIVCMH